MHRIQLTRHVNRPLLQTPGVSAVAACTILCPHRTEHMRAYALLTAGATKKVQVCLTAQTRREDTPYSLLAPNLLYRQPWVRRSLTNISRAT